jgi:hypothetical protein
MWWHGAAICVVVDEVVFVLFYVLLVSVMVIYCLKYGIPQIFRSFVCFVFVYKRYDISLYYSYVYFLIYLYCCLYELLQTGFGLIIGFTEHLQIVTTNISAIANSHTLQFTSQSYVSSLVVAW